VSQARVEIEAFLVGPASRIRDAVACIDRNGKGIALVTTSDRRLIATITDGDIRRAILGGIDLDRPIQVLLEHKAAGLYPRPITAGADTTPDQLLELMRRHALRHIPLVSANQRVVDVALLTELAIPERLALSAVVMAGGYGTRLRPLTENIPKSMLPVGDRPLLAHMIEQLERAGIHRVNLATHYRREIIAEHFGDGRDFRVEIQYVNEAEPLGTAGALSLVAETPEPLLVINGDILTRVDYRAMLDFHREHQADMTVAVRTHELRVPYGVVETDGVAVRGISEKPVVKQFINAGIYLLNPDVRRAIPTGRAYDMTELIAQLVAERRCVICFPVHEYWIDIGQADDYRRALADPPGEQ